MVGLLATAAGLCDVIVRFPLTFNVPIVEIAVVAVAAVGATDPPMPIVAVVIVPLPVIVPVVFNVAELGKVVDVVTVKVNVVLTEIVDPFPMVRALQVRLPSTVKVNPSPIITLSVAVGIVPPGQGAFGTVELQF